MLIYVRNHPLLFAACLVAAVIGVGLLAVVIAVAPASIRNSSPTGFAGHAAEFYGHNPHLHPFGAREFSEANNRLFGVTEAEGIAMLLACTDDKWKFVGQAGHQDSECNEYAFTRCDIGDKSLIASSWVSMGFEGVEFTACKEGFCPDLAVGNYIGDGPSCGGPFSNETSNQDRP